MADIRRWYSRKRHGKTQHIPINERRGRRHSAESVPSISSEAPRGATGWGRAGVATFPGTCLSCGEPIRRGDRIYFRRGQGAVHRNCDPPGEKWIQGAIRKPGALTETVERKYGEEGFSDGIKPSVLKELAEEPGKTGQRARLAERLREFHGKGDST